MPTLKGFLLIQASPEYLFSYTQDYTQRLHWDKYLRVARLEGGATQAGVGVEAYCESHKRIGMTVRYLSFNPPAQVAMEMTKGPWVFKKFSGSWRFKAVDPDCTQVFFRYNFKAKYEAVGAVLFHPVLRWLLKADIKNRLHYLKIAVERTKVPE